MGIALPQDRKKRALIGAIAAGLVAGALTMFIPTSVLESITGATGLSELVPATAAPLGDKARALIAFGTGALTLAVMTIFLLRKDDADVGIFKTREKQDDATEDAGTNLESDSFGDKLAVLKSRMPKISLPKMPWVKGDDEIRDLSDLPSVRSADSHPDAPARRPLLATKDLPFEADAPREIIRPPVVDSETEKALCEVQSIDEISPLLEVEPTEAMNPEAQVGLVEKLRSAKANEAYAAAEVVQEPGTAQATATAQPAESSQPSLTDMIAKLETSLGRRQKQLSELAKVGEMEQEMPATAEDASAEATAKQPAVQCPPLEAVPGNDEKPAEEMDTALNAALETLHRMNAQAR